MNITWIRVKKPIYNFQFNPNIGCLVWECTGSRVLQLRIVLARTPIWSVSTELTPEEPGNQNMT